MSDLAPSSPPRLDEPIVSYGRALALVSMGDRQFRAGLDRRVLPFGARTESGRWSFTLRDLFGLLISDSLIKESFVPIAVAGAAAKQFSPVLELLLEDMRYVREQKIPAAEVSRTLRNLLIMADSASPDPIVFLESGGEWHTIDGKFRHNHNGYPPPYTVLNSGRVMSRLLEFAQAVATEEDPS
ncbi:hypothetical protein [uncultured Sphingomonas sp.]|uniref:hypothetical protein n=1 Tax=uncultured Sphingomonas sp. TaxID=158754 RepID=UPI0025EF18B6|nr:hypothetical protein [uncultured Sphingomonas sp.]